MSVEIKRKRGRPPKVRNVSVAMSEGPKPSLPPLDPLQAQLDAGRNAIEGNAKLARTIDLCRILLQTLSVAEYDHEAKRPVMAEELRKMARDFLEQQGWYRKPIVTTRAGRADNDASKAGHIEDYNA